MAAIDRYDASPYQRGAVAPIRGLEEADNPYPVGSPEAAEWHRGFLAARKQRGELRPAEDMR